MVNMKQSICPLCQNENQCKVNDEVSLCWCMTVAIDENVLKHVPENLKGKQCICFACVEKLSSLGE